MALSIARPDPPSPADVSNATFTSSRRGFDSDEVREFLRKVAAEMSRLQERADELDKALQAARQAPTVSVTELEAAAVAGLLGEEATRIVATAKETASQIQTRAEEASSRLLIEANEEAQRVRADAEVEAGRRRQDAASLADDELQMAKQQGRDMVNEARAYRERVLGELARRREAARKQIEQLIANRDRLMQSFEKSRVIATEVIAELGPQAATSDLVDLSPITGPVPVISKAQPLPKPEPEPVVDPVVETPPVIDEVVVEAVDQADEVTAEIPVTAAPEREHAVDDLFARLKAESANKQVLKEKPKAKEKAAAAAPPPKPKAKAKVAPAPSAPEASQLSVFQSSPAEPQAVVTAVDSAFGRRDALLAPLIAAGSRNLKRVLADEQNDVLLKLGGREAVRTLDSTLPASNEHIRRYADSIADELMQAAMAGASSIDDSPVDEQRVAIERESALTAAIDVLATAVVSPLRDRLDRAVRGADGDNSELVGLTRTVYREWKTRRIDEHVDDVMLMAFGRGALAVLHAGTPICWAIDPAGPACPDAEDNALAGNIGAGEKFPTEHVAAPAHEGCRCMLLRAAR